MRSAIVIVALALVLTGSLFVLAKAAPADALCAYRQSLGAMPQSSLGCGCPGCSCVRCSCG